VANDRVTAGAEDVGSVKVATVHEGRKQPSSGQSGKTVTLDLHGTAPSRNDGVDGGVQGKVAMGEDNTVDMGVQLTREQKKQRDKAKEKTPSAKKNGGKKGVARQQEQHACQLAALSRPSHDSMKMPPHPGLQHYFINHFIRLHPLHHFLSEFYRHP